MQRTRRCGDRGRQQNSYRAYCKEQDAPISRTHNLAPHRVMVSGVPAPIRLASQVIARVPSRMQPCEAAVPSAPVRLFVPDADLSWASLEFLKDIRPGAGGQRKRSPGFIGGESEGLFDEKRSPRGRRRGLADHRTEVAAGTTAVVDGDASARKLDHDAPTGGGESRPVCGDPALVTVGPPWKSDLQPRNLLSAVRAAEDRKDGARSG